LPAAVWFGLVACGVGLSLFSCWSVYVASLLFACGVGLSLFSYWFICVAPVRGSTYFSLPPQRKVGKRKRAQTASF
jgi:membrane protein implicated in regulation of membrane protease activity